MASTPNVVEWSTEIVDASQRFDYYANALATALVPMRLAAPDAKGFRSGMALLDLGDIGVLRQHGTPRRCYRESSDPVFQRAYVLVANLSGSWHATHRGRWALQPGDAMLVDTGYDFDLEMFSPYETVGIRLSENWIRKWLAAPAGLVGRPIPASTGWGRALTSYMAQLSPQLLVNAPLPKSILIDQVGALLALTASELGVGPRPATQAEASLRSRIKETIAQACSDRLLTAGAVASSVGVSSRTLHRSLAASGETFGAILVAARAQCAVRMLTSPLMRRLTIAEIGRRAGFSDPSHFSRVLRQLSGRSPKDIRSRAASR